MVKSRVAGRAFHLGVWGAAIFLFASPGKSEPDRSNGKKACASAYKGALELEEAAHLLQAKDLITACAKASCGDFLQQRCTNMYLELEADIPSLVPLASDAMGAPRV